MAQSDFLIRQAIRNGLPDLLLARGEIQTTAPGPGLDTVLFTIVIAEHITQSFHQDQGNLEIGRASCRERV